MNKNQEQMVQSLKNIRELWIDTQIAPSLEAKVEPINQRQREILNEINRDGFNFAPPKKDEQYGTTYFLDKNDQNQSDYKSIKNLTITINFEQYGIKCDIEYYKPTTLVYVDPKTGKELKMEDIIEFSYVIQGKEDFNNMRKNTNSPIKDSMFLRMIDLVEEYDQLGKEREKLLTELEKIGTEEWKQKWRENQNLSLNKIIKAIENDETIDSEDWESLRNLILWEEKNQTDLGTDLFQFKNTIRRVILSYKHNIDFDIYNHLIDDIQSINKDLRGYNTFRDNYNLMHGSNSSRSFYMSMNDFYWSLNYKVINDEPVSVQNIILNLYQPISQHRNQLQVINAVVEGTDKILNGGLKMIGKWLVGDAGQKAADAARSVIDWTATESVRSIYNLKIESFSKDPQHLFFNSNYNKDNSENPMFWIQRLFHKGKWLNTYLLPFIAGGKVKNDYLHNSKDSDAWTIGGLTDGLSLNSTMQQIIKNGLNISLPYAPIYAMDNPHNSTYGEIPIDFYLINKNDQYLSKNFEFLHAMFAGTQWMNMEQGFIIAPNVYHVLVPGRFMIQWASMTMSILAIGKLRRSLFMYTKYTQLQHLNSIDAETLWPLVWHIILNIRPLTPWNFNTFFDYYQHGFGSERKNSLKRALMEDIDAPAFLKEIFNRSSKLQQNEVDLKRMLKIKAMLPLLLWEGGKGEDDSKIRRMEALFQSLLKKIEQNTSQSYTKEQLNTALTLALNIKFRSDVGLGQITPEQYRESERTKRVIAVAWKAINEKYRNKYHFWSLNPYYLSSDWDELDRDQLGKLRVMFGNELRAGYSYDNGDGTGYSPGTSYTLTQEDYDILVNYLDSRIQSIDLKAKENGNLK